MISTLPPARVLEHADSSLQIGMYLTFEEFTQDAHAILAERKSEQGSDNRKSVSGHRPDSILHKNARNILDTAARTGRILDSYHERRDFQREIDRILQSCPDMEGEEYIATLEEFDSARLRDVPVPPYPFNPPSEALSANAPTSEELSSFMRDCARTGKLRFDDGLVDEIATQLNGDPEGWWLLDFCLWQIYKEIHAQGYGNKLYRIDRNRPIDCRGLLVQKAKDLYDRMPQDAETLRCVLVALGTKVSDLGSEVTQLSDSFLRASDGLRRLCEERIVYRIPSSVREDGFRLAHKTLVDRWSPLKSWVHERQKKIRQQTRLVTWGASAIILVALVAVAGVSIWTNKIARSEEKAGRASMNWTLLKARLADPDHPQTEVQNNEIKDVIREAVSAYRKYPTMVAHMTLVNVVRGATEYLLHQKSETVEYLYLEIDPGGITRPTKVHLKSSKGAHLEMSIDDASSVRSSYLSPDMKRVAIIYQPNSGSTDKAVLYRWNNSAPLNQPAKPDVTIGTLCAGRAGFESGSWHFDASGDRYSYRCVDEVLPRMGEAGQAITFDREASKSGDAFVTRPVNNTDGDSPAVLLSTFAGMVQVLGKNMKVIEAFRAPRVGVVRPIDLAYDPNERTLAILDGQGAITLLKKHTIGLDFAAQLAPEALHVRALGTPHWKNYELLPAEVWFVPASPGSAQKCLSTRHFEYWNTPDDAPRDPNKFAGWIRITDSKFLYDGKAVADLGESLMASKLNEEDALSKTCH